MPRLYLVRHGKAEAGFGGAMDPALDETGLKQADAAAAKLAPLGPLPILTSPLKRTRQTAEPLARLWQGTPVVEEAVAEIPSPNLDLAERVQWLRKIMAGSWRDVGPGLAMWRENLIGALAAIESDTVIFSHYVAINVATGAALGDDRVTVFSPDNCSVTILEVTGGALTLVEKGDEAALTKVN